METPPHCRAFLPLFIAVAIVSPLEAAAGSIEFGSQIQPVLADKCYACHGPDEAERQADLRLDREQDVFAKRDGPPIVVPGAPDDSELWRRVSSQDESVRMPPPDSGLELTPAERQLLHDWIQAGAQWKQHWSFEPPLRAPMPEVRDRSWIRTPVDTFVLARLERLGRSPAPPADRVTLIRRVSLDLTGLPPTPKEVDRFLADQAPGAYQRLVDRLLSSPRFGERMAIGWLDASRYADTSGYQTDGSRSMWRWRDWVIEAFNRNLPFDRFTVEQLAGDLLPNPTLDQLIATGFHRNHRANSEGGIIDEEFLLEYAVDRVETTGTVWLGLTVGCARCHDHKYDPLTQADFYGLLAFFNNLPERGRVYKYHNSEPLVLAPTREMRSELVDLEKRLAEATRAWEAVKLRLTDAQAAWEKTPDLMPQTEDVYAADEAIRLPLDDDLRLTGVDVEEAKWCDGEGTFVEGRQDRAVRFDGQAYIDAGPVIEMNGTEAITVAAWVRLTGPNGAIVTLVDPAATIKAGFSVHFEKRRLQFHIGPRWIDDGLRIESQASLTADQWHHVAVTYDGSETADGVRMFMDGHQTKTTVLLDKLTGGFASEESLRVGFDANGQRLRGELDELRVYRRAPSPEEVAIVACPESIATILATPAADRSTGQKSKLAWYYLRHQAPQEIRDAFEHWQACHRQHAEYVASVPTTMVMQDQAQPPAAFLLNRGRYDQPGEKIAPGTPSWLPGFPDDAPKNRLGLARWLTSAKHPLTARVAVNRYWQMYFGRGLVETAEDFGTQGARPIHAPLLDWLATEFVKSGWDVKAMQKLIVLSATYRQSAVVDGRRRAEDPENQLLARFPRIRLPAEIIRDQALAAAGLLGNRLGGPSVKPYQPAGLWQELTSTKYEPDRGADLYRRSIYTFWKRTVPPAVMATFDGPTREFCQVRRSRTNTPLQALALMNDVTYVEAAREIARRMIGEADSSDEARLTHGFRLLLTRRPSERELQLLLRSLERSRSWFAKNKAAAEQLLKVGAAQPSPADDDREWAAFTTVASNILNLDETITRE